jgi:hypothetical protein
VGNEGSPACASPARNTEADAAVRRSYKFRLRPTRKQEAVLAECLEDTRQLYNAALEERREAWRMGRHKVNFVSQDAQLKEIRADDPERYGRWAFGCERAVIRRLDRAFKGFFKRVKAGEKPGYPRFKGRGWWDSIEWPEQAGAHWDSVPHPKVTCVYFKGIGHVRVHQHRTDSDRGRPPSHFPAVRPLRPHRSGEPRHPGRVPMSRLRPPGPRRHQRCHQHIAGRACPSGSLRAT